MHWNYRVMRHVDKNTNEEYLAIHEYYYDIEGQPDSAWSEKPDAVIGESIEDLRQTLEWMLKALEKPVLDYEDDTQASTDQSAT